MTKDLQAAAEVAWNEEVKTGICGPGTNFEHGFVAGATWAIKHSPEVLKLVDCITYILRHDQNSPERGRMREALKPWE